MYIQANTKVKDFLCASPSHSISEEEEEEKIFQVIR
jgi:hypothetical protein